MKRLDELDGESIQRWCEQLEQCKPERMNIETAGYLINLYTIEQNEPEYNKIRELIKEDRMSMLIRKRVKAFHTYELTDYATLFLIVLCDRPGIAVQMMNYIQYKCWKCKRKTVNMKVMEEIFPYVFFSMNDLERMWNEQKFVSSNGMTENMLDFPKYMESIKVI